MRGARGKRRFGRLLCPMSCVSARRTKLFLRVTRGQCDAKERTCFNYTNVEVQKYLIMSIDNTKSYATIL